MACDIISIEREIPLPTCTIELLTSFNALENNSVDCFVASARFLQNVESSLASLSKSLSRCAAESFLKVLSLIVDKEWDLVNNFPFFGNFSCFSNFNRIARLVDVKTKLSHVMLI